MIPAIKDYFSGLKEDLRKSYNDEDNLALFYRNSSPVLDRMIAQMSARRPHLTAAVLASTITSGVLGICAIAANPESFLGVVYSACNLPLNIVQFAANSTAEGLQMAASAIGM